MAANKTAGKGKELESGASGSQLGNAGMELSEKEIMEILQAQQQYERALEMARKYEEMLKTAEQKRKEIKPQILKEIKEKYGLEEKDIKEAFQDIENEGEIMEDIKNAIREEGKKAFERKDIREKAEKIRKIERIYRMTREEIRKLAVIFEEARRYLEAQMANEGKQEIHHTGRMSTESKEMLRHVREMGGRIGWKEFLQWSKETLALDSDTINKRRWQLITKGYLARDGNELVLTEKGYARLEEEGY